MKKIKLIPILTLMLLICFSITMFAAPDSMKSPTKITTYKASEITDIDKLLDRAKKEISDIPEERFVRPTYTLKNAKNNETKKGTSYVTTQLLEVSTDGNVTTNEYATTTISIVPSASLSEDNSNLAIGTSKGTNSSGIPINPSDDLYPTSNFYDQSVNFDWVNCSGLSYYNLGNSTDVTLTKGTGTWVLNHYNWYPHDS